MAGILETIQTMNSVLRTLLAVGVLGAMGTAGWLGYRSHQAGHLALEQKDLQLSEMRTHIQSLTDEVAHRQQQVAEQAQRIAALGADLQERDRRIEQLDAALHLSTVDHRVARLTALDQQRDAHTGQLRSRVQFLELDAHGGVLDVPREFEVAGDVVFIDAWVVKFEDRYVQDADPLRGASLVLFRRLFGEHQTPEEGFLLDEVGVRPRAYAGGAEASAFERRIWSEFWSLANDPDRAEALGIRAAHGEAPSIRVQPGKSYLLLLRASDGLTITIDPASVQLDPSS